MATSPVRMTKKEIAKWIKLIGDDWRHHKGWSTRQDINWHNTKQKAIEEWLRLQFK